MNEKDFLDIDEIKDIISLNKPQQMIQQSLEKLHSAELILEFA